MNEEKNTKKSTKATNMRKAISMVLVTVLLMSSATYAWFTLNSNAKVTGLTMKAVEEDGGLLISTDKTTWMEEVKASTDLKNAVFLPATVKNDLTLEASEGDAGTTDGAKQLTVFKPMYTNSQVTGVLQFGYKYDTDGKTGIVDADTKDKVYTDGSTTAAETDQYYYYEKVVYMKIPGATGAKSIYLDKNGTDLTDSTNAGKCVRIALTAKTADSEHKTKIIYSTDSITGSTSKADVIEKCDAAYGGVHDGNETTATDSAYQTALVNIKNETTNNQLLFQNVAVNQVIPVVIQMWFEGTDSDCVNEIKGDSFTANLAFTTNSVVKTA